MRAGLDPGLSISQSSRSTHRTMFSSSPRRTGYVGDVAIRTEPLRRHRRRSCAGRRSIGARPRHAMKPVNVGAAGPNSVSRMRECSRRRRSARRRGPPPSSSCQVTPPVVLFEVNAARADSDGWRPVSPRARASTSIGVQIAAMHQIHRRTEPLRRRRRGRDRTATRSGRCSTAGPPCRRSRRPRAARRLQPEREQHARAVRCQLQAGADLAQFGRLFVQVAVDAGLEQRQRRRRPPMPAPAMMTCGERPAGAWDRPRLEAHSPLMLPSLITPAQRVFSPFMNSAISRRRAARRLRCRPCPSAASAHQAP